MMGAFDDLIPESAGAQSAGAFDDIPVEPGFKPGDYLLGLKRGVEGLPGALTGLADIPVALATGDRYVSKAADKLGELTGFQPSKWAKEDAAKFSPGAKAAMQDVGQAWEKSGADALGNALLGNGNVGEAWDKANLADVGKVLLRNPGYAGLQTIESVPSMLVGGAIGKGVQVATKVAPFIAGALGEGAIAAGQNMDQTNMDADPRKAALAAAGAGLGDALIAGAGGKLAGKLGLEDVQTLMAGGRAAPGLSTVPRILGGAVSEGLLQELPQSMQEQAWQNYAEGKPLGEGVIRQGVEGGLAGGLIGGGANLLPARRAPMPEAPPTDTELGAAADEVAAAAHDYASLVPGDRPLLGYNPDASVITVSTPAGGTVDIDASTGPVSAAAVAGASSGALDMLDTRTLLRSYPDRQSAQAALDSRDDADQMMIAPHPRAAGRFAVVPKSRLALQAQDQAAARQMQLEQEDGNAPPVSASTSRTPAAPVARVSSPGSAEATQAALAQDAAQAELHPAAAQPVSELPGIQQRVAERLAQARAEAEARGARLIDEEANAAHPSPSPAQIAAGNYRKGHIKVGPLDISVENPVGSVRRGKENGKAWATTMQAHYGYMKRTEGADGDQVDVFVKEGTPSDYSGPVFVVDQFNPKTGRFDEHKAMIGYRSHADAAKAYDAHFSNKSGPKRRGAVVAMPIASFAAWAKDGDTSRPLSQAGKAADDAQAEIENSTGKLSPGHPERFNLATNSQKISRLDELVYSLAAENRSASEILAAISKASASRFNRQLAKLLIAKGIDAKVTIDSGKVWSVHISPGKAAAAAYSPKTNTAALFRPANAERHFLHEMLHAATLQALGKNGMAAGQMKALFRHVQKQLGKSSHYGLTNVEEFVAEAFSNPAFQQALKQTPAAKLSGSKLASAWHWFVRVVRGILGISTRHETALGQALDLGVELMQPPYSSSSSVNGAARQNIAERLPLLAPNGKLSNLSQLQWYQVRTPEFKRWFGDWENDPHNASKVVDENGEPLVVFHGTNKGTFTAFRADTPIFTASTRETAASYPGTYRQIDLNDPRKQKGIIPVFLNIRRPFIFDAQGKAFFELGQIDGEDFTDAVAKQVKNSEYDGVIFKDLIDDGGSLILEGSIYDEVEEPADVFAVNDPLQIKSAVQNTGKFDPTSPDLRFSAAGDSPEKLTVKDWTTHQLANHRGWMLGALTRDQLADIYGKQIPEVDQFDRVVQEMDQARNIIAEKADALVERWRKLPAAQSETLANVMHQATLSQYDPDQGGHVSTPDQSAVQKAWAGLSDEAKQVYRDVRDAYQATLVQLRNGLAKRAERTGTAGARTATEIRLAFDKWLNEGPYFPLARFGDFILIGNKHQDRVVEAFESSAAREKRARQLRLNGWTTKLTARKTYSAASDGPSGEFVGKVLRLVDGLSMDAKEKSGLMDDLNQLAISALPDQSYRKHFAHRKGTPGFSQDAMRAFASSMQHVSFHLARVLHADKLQILIDALNERVTKTTGNADTTEMQQVANELAKRLDLMTAPNTHPVTAALGQVGFVMSLGGSIASGLTNLSQTPLVTFPWLGAKFGFGKASVALTKASRDYLGGKWDKWSGFVLKDNKALSDDERRALRQLEEAGLINLTQAHDLAGTANTDKAASRRSYAINRAMKIIGWTFHVPEVFNRQVSALAAYRLARNKGLDHDQALEVARDTLRRTAFDYSGSNRSRWMAGNFTRVVTMFKQFSQQMTYLLWRQAYLALKGESPEVRREARRMLLGIAAMHFSAAGALGLPLGVFGISPLLSLLAMGMGGPDEPWDWQTEFRNMLADTFGKPTGEAIAHGPLRALLGIDFAARVGLGDLWVRSPQAEKEGRDLVEAWMLTLLGPVAGYAGNIGTAMKAFDEGKYGRGLESMLPKFIAAPLKATRYETEGVKSWRGDDLGVALHGNDILATAVGFNPSTVAEMYEGRRAIKNKEAKLVARREEIANMFVSAALAGDREMQDEALTAAMHFSEVNPDMAINADSLRRALQAKVRNQALIQDGIYLQKRREDLRAEGRFANVE